MPQETDRLKLPLPLGNENVTRESINGIFEKIDAGVATQADMDALREVVSKMDIPDASLTQKGKVQLSDAINSTVKDKAATPSAVKMAYDEATAAKQLGVEQKNNVVATLNSIGVSASTSESWAQLITKMSGVIKATGNAVPAQVLAGVSFSNASANGRTGTMPNRSAEDHHQPAVNSTVWPGDRIFLMPSEGYFNGQSWVYALTPDLRPENILFGKNILGVVGSFLGIIPGDHRTFGYEGQVQKWLENQYKTFYSIKFSATGRYRISYTANTSGGYKTYRSRIFVNGSPLGTEHISTQDMSDIIYTEDFYISAGDTIQFMGMCDSGGWITMFNFEVKSNVSFVGTIG